MVILTVESPQPVAFSLRLRLPEWLSGPAVVSINGVRTLVDQKATFYLIQRIWENDIVSLELPKSIWLNPVPDEPEKVAFMDGPVVLAGLCEEERLISGNRLSVLIPDNEREWTTWKTGYRTQSQIQNIKFIPIHEVVDQTYTVYFPVDIPLVKD